MEENNNQILGNNTESANNAVQTNQANNYSNQQQNYQNNQGYYQQPPQFNQFNNRIPPEYKPISAWGYVGWDLLFGIPLVGFILLIVFACGATGNINLKKYAQSKFCALLLALIITIIVILIGVFAFGYNVKIPARF